MATFQIGDQVQMPGIPLAVEVLELGVCEDGDDCELGLDTFRFIDPSGEYDWAHCEEFVKVPA